MREKQKPSVCVNQLPERERRLREVGAQHGMSRAERTTDRSRGCRSQAKRRQSVATKGPNQRVAYPRCGEGCGDTLTLRIFFEVGSDNVQ
jgi:hypothetical protein